MRSWAIVRLLIVSAFFASAFSAPGSGVEFREGDRVIFLGNTFAERLRNAGYFETLLLTRMPDKKLTFRNLGWSADEITLQPRPMDFGEYAQHLTEQGADVIFLFYGSNESFAGEAGLADFQANVGKFIDGLLSKQFNGESPSRLVLVSPIPQEQVGPLPDPKARNAQIATYVFAMKKVADEKSIPFLNIFDGVLALMKEAPEIKLTFNGVHLTEYGDWAVAQVMYRALGAPIFAENAQESKDGSGYAWRSTATSVELVGHEDMAAFEFAFAAAMPRPPQERAHPSLMKYQTTITKAGVPRDAEFDIVVDGASQGRVTGTELGKGVALKSGSAVALFETIRQDTIRKNRLFFDRWRAVNGFYIYGGRKEPFGVLSFPPEMKRFDELASALDSDIQKLLYAPPPVKVEIVPVTEP